MIQAPGLQYIPTQQMAQPAPMQQSANNAVQYYPQYPGAIYSYPTSSSYLPQASYAQQRPQYNGVNIEIHNPQGHAAVPNVMQNTMPAQYVPVQQPIYPMQQPIMQPVATQPVVQEPQVAMPQVTMPQPVIQPVPAEPIVMQQQEVPAPQIQPTQQDVNPATTPVIEQPAVVDPNKTPTAFAGRLNTNDVEAQKTAIEEIAEAVKNDDTLAPTLLDTQIFDALIGIIGKDTSSLEGPTPEVSELRQKPENELTPEQLALAQTPAPREKAEINKQYALYTIAYLQERLNNELEKRGGQALELKDLPAIDKVIETIKSDANPQLRTSAIAALSHIARPEYSADIKTVLEIAKTDEDPGVQDAANTAIGLLK